MNTKLAHVPLADITVSETNKMFREEAELTDQALKELVDSIRTNGVISPVMLTPRSDGPTKYMLVCGERRYRAATFAGLKSIPCNIRELTDDQVLDLQLIENLERKDVHPAKEARAYKMLMAKHPELTLADLALKFAKTEHYISIRLKLNDLIPEAMEDFSKDLMSIGHAMLIARLTPADQRELLRQCIESFGSGKDRVRYYSPVAELKDFIEDNVICNLSAAAFKKEDATLIPKAGACTTCPKRSGANQLFSDVIEKDRCFDRACYQAKRMKFLITQIPSILEAEPEIQFFANSYYSNKIDPEVEKVLKDNKVKILKQGEDFSNNDWSNNKAKIKGIWINGDMIGTRVTMFSEHHKRSGKKPSSGNSDTVDVKVAIENIKQRTKRAAELDQEKIFAAVIDQLTKHKEFLYDRLSKPVKAERGLIAQMIFNHADYTTKDQLRKILKLGTGQHEAEALKSLTDMDLALMARCIAVKQYSSPYNHNKSEGLLIVETARAWDIPVDDLIKTQDELRKKREARAKERIAALKPEKKGKKSETKIKRKAKKQKA